LGARHLWYDIRAEERSVARIAVLTLIAMTAFATEGRPQEWAQKMFKTTHHDFGSVARGAKAEFAFELVNSYKEDIHIAGVRSSCGCTTPVVTKDTLKTWEKAEVVAALNTRSFNGHKNATITVTIDQPFSAEVQLTVTAYIRRDVVFSPGVVQFGSVPQGKAAQKTVEVNYAGRDDWKIVDVRSANPHFEVELNEKSRGGGRVAYTMLVRMNEAAPAGYILDQLTIVTNDHNLTTVPLAVEGRVTSPLTVSPASLVLGVLSTGQSVTKQLVVRGNQPFRIVKIDCSDPRFHCETPAEAKEMHLVPITFTAGAAAGKVAETLVIKTDLGGGEATCKVTATIEQAVSKK
jgi:hypothetical protein